MAVMFIPYNPDVSITVQVPATRLTAMPQKSFAFGSVALAIVWGVFFYPPPAAKPVPHPEPAAATRVAATPGQHAVPTGHIILR
jgi:hypothetical protein